MEGVPVPVDPMVVLEEIRWTLRRLVAATIVLFVALIGGGVYVYLDADRTGDALCALRVDLEVRVNANKDFLIRHPKGIPGVKPAEIQTGIKNQERTIDALGNLSCPPS